MLIPDFRIENKKIVAFLESPIRLLVNVCTDVNIAIAAVIYDV
jgi:hypothetical protein